MWLAPALLAVGYVGYQGVLRYWLNRRIQAIRNAGYPATLEELDEWYGEPPPGKNAAEIYIRAAEVVSWPTDEQKPLLPLVGKAALPPPGDPVPSQMISDVSTYLDANREAVRLFREGASRERCRYPTDLTEGIAARHPPLGQIRIGTDLLALAACRHSWKGDPEAAAKTLVASLALADSPADAPLLVLHFVRLASHRGPVSGLEYVLGRGALPVSSLNELEDALRTLAGRTQGLLPALVGERMIFLQACKEVANPESLSHWRTVWFQLASGLLHLDIIYFLDIMERYIEAEQEPFPGRIETWRRLSSEVEGEVTGHEVRHFLTNMRMSSYFGRLALSEAEYLAQVRLALLAMALEQFRLGNGRLPANLLALVPTYIEEVPADPFGGQPVRYRIERPGYVLYSIGRNEADDGGTETEDEETGDIVFRVRR